MKKITEKDYQQRILKVLLFIQKHMDDDLDLDQLSRIACFSPFHFHRIFKANVGESVGEYVRRLKLERSVQQFTKKHFSLLDIALHAGFESHEAYSRAFKKMFGCAPSIARIKTENVLAQYKLDYSARIAQLKSEGEKNMREVKIKTIDPVRVAFIRHIGPYMQVGPTMVEIVKWAQSKGIDVSKAMVIGVAHDDPHVTQEDKLRFDACVSIDDAMQPEGKIGVQTIPGGEHAVVVHKGPYEGLTDVFHWLYGVWLPQSGREAADTPCIEIYKNCPRNTAPEDLITEIYLPLKG